MSRQGRIAMWQTNSSKSSQIPQGFSTEGQSDVEQTMHRWQTDYTDAAHRTPNTEASHKSYTAIVQTSHRLYADIRQKSQSKHTNMVQILTATYQKHTSHSLHKLLIEIKGNLQQPQHRCPNKHQITACNEKRYTNPPPTTTLKLFNPLTEASNSIVPSLVKT